MTRRGVVCAIAVWAIAVTAFNVWFFRYAGTPGEAPSALASWPSASRLQRTEGLPTLVVFAHPHCACTRATIEELARIEARIAGRARIHVVFARPDGVDDAWMHSDLWEHAQRIPTVAVIADDAQVEANAFGVKTSGTALLFDSSGAVRFSGGITASRGHEGPSVGQERVVAGVLSDTYAPSATNVYGCALAGVTP